MPPPSLLLLPATSRDVSCFIIASRITSANLFLSGSYGTFELSLSEKWCSPTLGMSVPAGP